jgi:hypothetical protein
VSSNRSLVTLTVYQHRDWASSSVSQLWGRLMVHHFLPQEGQRMYVLTDPEEPNGSGGAVEVVDVTFGFDGSPHIMMESVIVDPDEEGEKSIHRGIRTSNPRNRRSSWWTERDGDLAARLRQSGWLPYTEWPEQMKDL